MKKLILKILDFLFPYTMNFIYQTYLTWWLEKRGVIVCHGDKEEALDKLLNKTI